MGEQGITGDNGDKQRRATANHDGFSKALHNAQMIKVRPPAGDAANCRKHAAKRRTHFYKPMKYLTKTGLHRRFANPGQFTTT
jgi:hypothetical protein